MLNGHVPASDKTFRQFSLVGYRNHHKGPQGAFFRVSRLLCQYQESEIAICGRER